jgi:hypothetical protein
MSDNELILTDDRVFQRGNISVLFGGFYRLGYAHNRLWSGDLFVLNNRVASHRTLIALSQYSSDSRRTVR